MQARQCSEPSPRCKRADSRTLVQDFHALQGEYITLTHYFYLLPFFLSISYLTLLLVQNHLLMILSDSYIIQWCWFLFYLYSYIIVCPSRIQCWEILCIVSKFILMKFGCNGESCSRLNEYTTCF